MRVWSRIALIFVFVFAAPILCADHFRAECPMSLVDTTPAAADFDVSPHGVFRNGTLVHVLRGNRLITYNTNDVGNLDIARDDIIGSLAARETNAGVGFGNGFLYISSEAGLEVFDLRNVRAGGNEPILLTRVAGRHYRRLAVNGTRLAGLYPVGDLPCYPSGTIGDPCHTTIDVYNITAPASPTLLFTLDSRTPGPFGTVNKGHDDIAFNFGFLMVLSESNVTAGNVLAAYNVSGAAPVKVTFDLPVTGKWLISNGSNVLGIGSDYLIYSYNVDPTTFGFFTLTKLVALPEYLMLDRANAIRFHNEAFFDDANARLITMIEEVDPMTLEPARTIAFDVFDYTVHQFEGSAERIYEDVTFTSEDEVKYDPIAAGAFVYVVGEESGVQEWGACGRATGRIELDSPLHLSCGGTEIHGWVTGTNKIVNVELFLDNTSLGSTSVGGPARTDVSSTTTVFTWRIPNINLDATPAGSRVLRAIATDALANRRQFASKRLYVPGPGLGNCSVPRRRSVR